MKVFWCIVSLFVSGNPVEDFLCLEGFAISPVFRIHSKQRRTQCWGPGPIWSGYVSEVFVNFLWERNFFLLFSTPKSKQMREWLVLKISTMTHNYYNDYGHFHDTEPEHQKHKIFKNIFTTKTQMRIFKIFFRGTTELLYLILRIF